MCGKAVRMINEEIEKTAAVHVELDGRGKVGIAVAWETIGHNRGSC